MTSKPTLSSKRWLVLFALTALLLSAGVAVFNVLTDPFGVFGDPVLQWWSYDETNNPRIAKHNYLKKNHEQYDSYIIGCSSTSSYPVEKLNEYFDASFYNLIMYGADMLDVEQFSRYLADHYTVKNLVVNVYIDNGLACGTESDPLSQSMPWDVEGSSPLAYYTRFLLADPRFGWEKLQKRKTDSVIQAAHDVFDESTGAYDKSLRDVEHIGDLESYLESYPVFKAYPRHNQKLAAIQECMERLAAIRDMCEERGIRLTVVAAPVYYDYLLDFDHQEVEEFFAALAEVTPFWDFTASSVSRDPRYFYDETHFRNCVGDMALARAAGDDSIYIPEDFGVYVTPENVREVTAGYWSIPEPDPAAYTAQVPVLMYHDIAEDYLPAEQFEEQIAALAEAGYTAVTFEDLRAYVEQGRELPEKPVALTFDDGYLSNMTYGLPILEKYGMKATIFAIGCSVGKDTYKDTGVPMHPHFTVEQAREMIDTGLIAIGSHGYDIHEVEGRDPDPVRMGILPREGETEREYMAFLREDYAAFNALMEPAVGGPVQILAYPYGYYNDLCKIVLRELGVYATVTIHPGTNTLVKGIPQSLIDLDRYNMDTSVTGEAAVEMLETDKH